MQVVSHKVCDLHRNSRGQMLSEIPMHITLSGIQFVSIMGAVSYGYTTDDILLPDPYLWNIKVISYTLYSTKDATYAVNFSNSKILWFTVQQNA